MQSERLNTAADDMSAKLGSEIPREVLEVLHGTWTNATLQSAGGYASLIIQAAFSNKAWFLDLYSQDLISPSSEQGKHQTRDVPCTQTRTPAFGSHGLRTTDGQKEQMSEKL